MVELKPFALQNTPALIEKIFPAQKISFEAQKERKAAASQTLTCLGSYWKGRKPLILVRAIVLGSLLPRTGDDKRDLKIFEALMGIDDEGLARRALIKKAIKPKDFASSIKLDNPWDYFAFSTNSTYFAANEIKTLSFPFNADANGIRLRWRPDVDDEDKLLLYKKVLKTYRNYEEKSSQCKRPEEVDQEWFYESVWTKVNRYYGGFGINAHSHQELIEQLGILRYGHRPRVGDVFSGGGSIPFEAARIGCDVYASDLNPIACMLTWGALNIIGGSSKHRNEREEAQIQVAKVVDEEITKLGIEHDKHGNRAKSHFYCLETRCPETGWLVPMSPTWIISNRNSVIARLSPNYNNKRFDIKVMYSASAEDMKMADKGTIQDGALVYQLDGKTYRIPIRTLRGDYRDAGGITQNHLRLWEKHDFKPRPDDIFQERLYAIHWIKRGTENKSRQTTYYASVSNEDLVREREVENIVERNIVLWQERGIVPDMEIERGEETARLSRERGWTYWHHLFNARQLLLLSLYFRNNAPENWVSNAKLLDRNSRLTYWLIHREHSSTVFYNQALNPLYNYSLRCFTSHESARSFGFANSPLPKNRHKVANHEAKTLAENNDIYITDPPYADAVQYHEITEYFIAWLRKNPPPPFNEWIWDSRRALAIKGSGDGFRRGMIDAYRAMVEHMSSDGIQCVMFTHQNIGVWSDMTGIFWAAGLQVVAAWYIATETSSGLKKGGYIQGTVVLILRKRNAINRAGFKQRILPAVRAEVERQIKTMMHLNDEVKEKLGEPVFNDSDLQMAGYAAALKVLTAYTHIGGEDVTDLAMRPKQTGVVTVVDEIVQQATDTANSLLIPEGVTAQTWQRLNGIQRFYLRMMDVESTGTFKLDNYQNFQKAFRVDDYAYAQVVANQAVNTARLKQVTEFTQRDLTDSNGLGKTWLGHLISALQDLLAEIEPKKVIEQLQFELDDFMEARPLLIDLLDFMEKIAPEYEVRQVAEVLGDRLRNLRALGQ